VKIYRLKIYKHYLCVKQKTNQNQIMQQQEYIIEAPKKVAINWAELWRYRELFYFFTWRDIKVKYKQTVLGFLWAILQPLAMMTVFVVFFAKGLNISTDNLPAPVFYFVGLMFWNLFSSGLNSSANSMVTNAEIIKKIYFPRLIVPFSGILVALFDFLMTLIPFIGLMIYYSLNTDFTITYDILYLLPLSLILTLTTTVGLGCTIAAWNVKYRDFRYIVPFMIQFLLFVTPVIYPVTMFDNIPFLKYILALNPMTGVMIMTRNGFSTETLPLDLMGISIFAAVILLIVGLYTFRKMEAYFADIA
jgi:lipopolysaccharide transport system permease protein